jgi:hypothetical protein
MLTSCRLQTREITAENIGDEGAAYKSLKPIAQSQARCTCRAACYTQDEAGASGHKVMSSAERLAYQGTWPA